MKSIQLFSVLVTIALFSAMPDAYSQTKTHHADASGADSIPNFCKETLLNNCSGCHGTKCQGDAGPNLADKYWLHGGGIKNISHTIAEGVSGKGMISWKTVFSDQEIQQISACVLSLQATNPPKAKKPEGEFYESQKLPQKAPDKKDSDSLR
jgi:mono/diheme cytochrome c family protein